jgi:hypothetical protein
LCGGAPCGGRALRARTAAARERVDDATAVGDGRALPLRAPCAGTHAPHDRALERHLGRGRARRHAGEWLSSRAGSSPGPR